MSRRSFRLEKYGKEINLRNPSDVDKLIETRMISPGPASAAKKFGNRLCRLSDSEECSCVLVVKETTRGSKGKEFKYHIERKYEPRVVMKNGKEITFNYSIILKSLKD